MNKERRPPWVCIPIGERGAALFFAVLSLFVVSVLIGAVVLMTLAEVRMGRGFGQTNRAFSAGEEGLAAMLVHWDHSTYMNLGMGSSASFTARTSPGDPFYEASVRRLGAGIFLITSTGTTATGSRARLGMVVGLAPVFARPRGALTVSGSVAIGTDARVSGIDALPDGWSCDSPVGLHPAIHISPADSVSHLQVQCDPSSCLSGFPPILADPSVADLVDTIDWPNISRIERIASVVTSGPVVAPQPVWSNGICVTAVRSNWGDPYASGTSCNGYFPLVLTTGDLEIRGGRGQGVLVVDGDLRVSGGFVYAGLVLVRGSVTMEGIGNRIGGAIVVANANEEHSTVGGKTVIRYSSCALETALRGSARPEPLRERSWFQAY